MDPVPRALPDKRRTDRTLFWLELLGLALGSITYAIDPLNFIHPGLAVAGIVWLAVAMLAVRLVSALQSNVRVCRAIEIAALLVYAVLLTTSTGATNSPFISLYALPVVASALYWKRWQVLLLSVAIVVLALIQSGLLDAMNDLHFLTTAAILINVLAPSFAAALVLLRLQGRIGTVEQQFNAMSATDTLTGLLNLQAFEALLEVHHREVERTGQSYSIAMIDVDDLRQMNESLGHEAGSQMIATVAKAITRSIRSTDHAARMGGDVFVVLLSEADQGTASAIAQRIRNNVYSGTLLVENRMVRATVSVGLVTYPRDAPTPKSLLILADQRMEQDKLLRRAPAR
jgi:diguanylate cyclase (GGDEF)-like protein